MRPSKGSQPLVLVGTRAPTHDDGEDTLVIKDLVGGEDLGNQCASSGRVLETGKRGREGNDEVRGWQRNEVLKPLLLWSSGRILFYPLYNRNVVVAVAA
ncbi:hypothetical protein QL285_050246 [Trifolium repens]|nr:hypothetical protein QL285_050246 [Trifolium repens]